MQGVRREHAWRSRAAILFICAAIALWGFAHRLYTTLLPDLAAVQALSSLEIDLARAGLAIGYVLMTLPAAFVSRNLGYKIGMVIGLGAIAVGMFLFYPAVEHHSYGYFFVAATIMGSGLALMEVMTAALIVFLGSRDSAAQRSNLAQAFAPAGALAGMFFGQHILGEVFAAPPGQSAHALVLPLFSLGTAIIVLMFLIDLLDFPPVAGERVARGKSTLASFAPPLQQPFFRYALIAQFLSLGAQIVLAAFAVRYCLATVPGLGKQEAHAVFVWCIAAFGAGRLIGPLLMLRLDPMDVLVAFSAATLLCGTMMVLGGGQMGVAALIATSFFLSIQYPTIFAYAIRDLGEMAKSGASLLIFVAFSGTAVLALAAVTAKPFSAPQVMVLTLPCFAGALYFTLAMRRLLHPKTDRTAAGCLTPGKAPRPKMSVQE